MSFLDPLFLAGLGVAAVPIVIHLINRRKARRERFAAIEFVLRSQRRTARRWRIKQFALLAVRTLAILAIPLALARPYATVEGIAATTAGSGPSSVVLVVDDSMSMRWEGDEGVLLDRAVRAARDAVVGLGEEDNAALVLSGASARAVVAELTFDREVLMAALDEQVEESWRGTDLPGALGLAWGILEGSALEDRRIVVFTDGQSAGFDLAKLPWKAGQGPAVIVRDVSEGASRPNRTVTDVAATPAPEAGSGVWRFEVSVRATGGDAPVETPLTLEVDGQAVARGFVTVPPGRTVVKTLTAPVRGDGLRRGRVFLAGDGLAADDARSFSLRVRPSLRVLLVNGDPRSVPYRDEIFYLEKALLPGTGMGSRLRPRVIQAAGLVAEDLAEYDVVFLANVGGAPPGVAGKIEAWVRGGGGLVVAAGDRLSGEEARWMDSFLPGAIRGVRRLGGDTGAPKVRLGPPPAGLPMFELFRGPGGEGLRAATFERYLLVEPAGASAKGRRTLLSYGDGAPALLERSVGAGRAMLLTTTVDRDWSDLAVSSGFLPLMQEICHEVARSGTRSTARTARVGGALPLPAPPGSKTAEVRDPDGGRRALSVSGQVSVTGLDAPGVYALAFRGRGGAMLAEEDLVVVPPPEEGDLTALGPEVVAALSGEAPAEADAASSNGALAAPERRVNLWPWALLMLVALLMAETGLLVRRRPVEPR